MKALTSLACALLIACSEAVIPSSASAFDQSHAELDAVMKRYVVKGMVDYTGLKANRAGLDSYITKTSAVSATSISRKRLLRAVISVAMAGIAIQSSET